MAGLVVSELDFGLIRLLRGILAQLTSFAALGGGCSLPHYGTRRLKPAWLWDFYTPPFAPFFKNRLNGGEK